MKKKINSANLKKYISVLSANIPKRKVLVAHLTELGVVTRPLP